MASLVLLAHRDAGGWLPWAALVAGTAASVAAHIGPLVLTVPLPIWLGPARVLVVRTPFVWLPDVVSLVQKSDAGAGNAETR